MKKKKDANPRLDPREELCAQFDFLSIKDPEFADNKEKGVTVTDNCAQEHTM